MSARRRCQSTQWPAICSNPHVPSKLTCTCHRTATRAHGTGRNRAPCRARDVDGHSSRGGRCQCGRGQSLAVIIQSSVPCATLCCSRVESYAQRTTAKRFACDRSRCAFASAWEFGTGVFPLTCGCVITAGVITAGCGQAVHLVAVLSGERGEAVHFDAAAQSVPREFVADFSFTAKIVTRSHHVLSLYGA